MKANRSYLLSLASILILVLSFFSMSLFIKIKILNHSLMPIIVLNSVILFNIIVILNLFLNDAFDAKKIKITFKKVFFWITINASFLYIFTASGFSMIFDTKTPSTASFFIAGLVFIYSIVLFNSKNK